MRSLIKSALDEWSTWLNKARKQLIPRNQTPPWPDGMALAFVGVRRSGKTFAAIEAAASRSERVLYFNFEDPVFVSDNRVQHLDTIISVYQEFSGHDPGVLIFDEIHNIDGWEKWVRKVVDTRRWPLIITGSSAKLLSSEIATSIAGRCIEKTVWPLSYSEYLKFSDIRSAPSLASLRNYFKWGGFPALTEVNDPDTKTIILKQYLSDIVLKDVISRHEIRNKRHLDQIVAFAMTNLSSLCSYQSVRKAFGMTADVAQTYSGYLGEAFMLFEVQRYHHNLKVQARDPKKIYVIDPGLRRIAARSVTDDLGKIAENIVYLELRRRGHDIYYFQAKGEVDFVLVEGYRPLQAVQVCYSDMMDAPTFEREVGSLLEALVALDLSEGTILTLNRHETLQEGKKTLRLIPLFEFLTQE